MSNGVPASWAIKPLSELAIVDAKSLKSSTQPDYRFHYIDIASVKTGRVDFPAETITYSEAPSRARKLVRKGDVLMSNVRPNLQAFAYFDKEGDDFVASTGFSVITAKDMSDGKFIYQSILADDVSRQIAAMVAGSNYPAISSSNVKNLELVAPPLPEQQKIAAILSSVDDVIEKTRAQIDKLKDLKTGMMQELLTKGIGSGGVPHTEFKDSPVGKIPVTWEVLEVGNFLSERRTRGLEGLPIYSVLVDGGMVPRDTVDRRVTSGLDASENRLAKQGDLAYNMMRMWQGASGIAPTNCLVSPAYVVCRPSERIHSDFLGYLLKSPAVIQLLHRYSQGLTGDRLRLYFDSFKRIKLPIPPLEEQIKIADALNALDDEIDNKSMQLSLRQSLKRALMQDLLTGKVRVKVDQKESAVA